VILEEDRAGHIGRLATEHRQMHNAPGNNQIDGQAVLDPPYSGELALLDPVSAL